MHNWFRRFYHFLSCHIPGLFAVSSGLYELTRSSYPRCFSRYRNRERGGILECVDQYKVLLFILVGLEIV